MDIHRTLAQGLNSCVFERIDLCHKSGYTPSNSTMQTILHQLQYFEYCLVVLIWANWLFWFLGKHSLGNLAQLIQLTWAVKFIARRYHKRTSFAISTPIEWLRVGTCSWLSFLSKPTCFIALRKYLICRPIAVPYFYQSYNQVRDLSEFKLYFLGIALRIVL